MWSIRCSRNVTRAIREELKWIDEHIDGKPYGVDVLIPNKMVGKDEKFNPDKLAKMIPQEYADFRTDVLENHGIEAPELREIDTAGSEFARIHNLMD